MDRRLVRILRLLLLLLLFSPCLQAASYSLLGTQVRVCPAHNLTMPDFAQADCTTQTATEINPHHQALWIKGELAVPQSLMQGDEPIGLFVSGKMSSRVYLNGELLGENGRPGLSAQEEIAGQMDVVLAVSRSRLLAHDNELVMLISGQHSLLELVAPIHAVNFGSYRQPTDYLMSMYWQSYAVLGALVVACIYLGALAWRSPSAKGALGLTLMSLASAAQLLFEVWRAAAPYSYPFHDIRLMLILACSIGFALALLYHLLERFSTRNRLWTWLFCTVLVLIGGLGQPGFDHKSSMSILIACLLGASLCLYWRWQGNRRAAFPALVLTLYILALIFSPSQFLDSWFYFLNAAFLLFFASMQAASLTSEQRLRRIEQQRAERLQLALDRLAQSQSPKSLSISSAGQLHTLDTQELEYCKSDRDYVEFFPIQGKPLLDSSTSLTQLETELPSTFLRVHRSYIVNTNQIRALERDANGTGRLVLASGSEVPVSRRILPSVRKALA